jgi:hypothetical protein
MAWKNRYKLDFKIEPNDQETVTIDIDPKDPLGGDFGAYIVPNPLTPGGELRIDWQAKRRKADNSVTYVVAFTNIGTVPTEVDFAGGGLN